MIGKVKKWLGIEGVKLELVLPDAFDLERGKLGGRVRLRSMHPQTVVLIQITLIERYRRGRGQEKLVDEYELGRSAVSGRYEVPADGMIEVPFELEFEYVPSRVEAFGQRNLFFGGLAKAARAIQGASSEFRVEAEAKVAGVALNPFDKRVIELA